MIPKAYIDEWRQYAPWRDDYQVEQDLIISRALNAIFSDTELKEKLAFRWNKRQLWIAGVFKGRLFMETASFLFG